MLQKVLIIIVSVYLWNFAF